MKRQAKRRLLVVLAVVVVVLIGLRLALPTIVERYVNRVLDRSPDYDGHVTDVDIALIRGAYVIDGLLVEKTEGKAPVPFLDIERIDLSVEWRALLDGAFVAEVELQHPKVNFVGGSGAQNQAGGDTDWRETVKDLVPLEINRFAVVDGEVHYVDPTARPKVDVEVMDLQLEAYNLTNSEDLSGSLVATVEATGKPLNLGDFRLQASVDPYADTPTFDLDAAIRRVPLKQMNDFIKAYGKLDVEAGTMDVFTELAAENGKFSGYLKPLLKDVKVVDLPKDTKEGNPIQVAWEAIVGGAKGLLENDKTEKVATRIPIGGSFDDPKVNAWVTVGLALRNGFLKALFEGIEGTVDMNDPDAVTAGEAPEDPGNEDKRGGGLFKRKHKR
jgi:hypothetical protein